jgi:CheY-like chemotaxis protein
MRDDPLRDRVVLVIEDDDEYRDIIRRLVEFLGARVLTAADGLAGLRQMEPRPPDLVLCDLTMPIMDGLTFARCVRNIPRYRRVLLVAVTARGAQRDLLETWRTGFDAHLVKPVTLEALRAIALRWSGPAAAESSPGA